MRFLIILILVLLPNISYAVDITRFEEENAPVTSELESKRNNEAGLIGERQVRGLFWNTGIISLTRTYIAEIKLENDPDFNVHEHLDEFMDGITANYTPWFTKRADSYEEGIMLRGALLDRFAAYEKAEAAGWKGSFAIMIVRMINIAPLGLLIAFALSRFYRRTRSG